MDNLQFVSPTYGKLSFRQMFKYILKDIEKEQGFKYNIIVGTDSSSLGIPLFVTAVIVHKIGRGGCYFYRKIREQKKRNLHQRIFYEATLSLELASLFTSELAKNGKADLPIEIHLDVGGSVETKEIIRELVGMITGSGYKAKTKPDAYGASVVADKHSK